MTSGPGDLAPRVVLPALRTRWMGRTYRYLPSCGSSNDEAAALARAGARDGLLLVADHQSGGRGRLGRSWHSPPGENLYLSVVLRPALPPLAVPPLTLLAGAALAEAVAAVSGLAPRLKWPNDLQLDTPEGPRKAAGILTEMATERAQVKQVILGVGVNVNVAAFPPELAGLATSLHLAAGGGDRRFDRGALLAAFLGALEPAYEQWLAAGPGEAIARWRSHARLGHRCRVVGGDGGAVEGIARDVDGEGALLVEDDGGRVHRIVAGEMT